MVGEVGVVAVVCAANSHMVLVYDPCDPLLVPGLAVAVPVVAKNLSWH